MATLLVEHSLLANLVAREIPRPEYPEPQFQREQWLNLNGTWKFSFDDEDRGIRERWELAHTDFALDITVPFCFESQNSGINDPNYHPFTWYRRTFTVPEHWQGQRLLLHFGAVDYRAMVWVNGRLAGSHEGGNTPFHFDITHLLEPGGNIVTVRAEDPPLDRHMPRGKQYWGRKSESIFYTRTSGIWQTVWLQPVGQSFIERVRVEAEIDGSVAFEARLAHAGEGLQFHATVRMDGRVVARSMGEVENGLAGAGVVIRSPKLWSDRTPHLYDVTYELHRGDEVVDRVDSYFGFRKIVVQGNQILLNGNPVYLKMVLDQGYWPESNLTPPSDQAIIDDISATKEMGFNGARKHQKVEDPRYLYWADKMGLLVSAEMANAYDFDELAVARVTREWIDIIERDRNHPSIIIWVPINESWGVPDLSDKRQQAHLRAMYHLTKSLDDTRLVIDNDGWEHTEATDLFAIHDYTKTGEVFYERFKEFGKPGIPVPNFAKTNLVEGSAYNNAPVYLSEFGGVSYIPPDTKTVPIDSWGYSGIERTREETLQRIRGLYEALAKVPQIQAICYTQLADVEQEVNGLLTYDRRPKFDFAEIRAMNELLTARWP